MSKLVIRRATLLDYTAAVDIQREVPDKLDYLPVLYYSFFQRNRHVAYIVEEEGVPVSFAIMEISGGGSDVTLMAVRTRPSHQGRSLSANKNHALRQMFKKEFPSITREIQCLRVSPGNEKLRNDSEIVNHLNSAGYSLIISRISESINHYKPSQPVHNLSYLQSLHILNNSNVIENFLREFSGGYIPADENGRPIRIDSKTDLRDLFQTNYLCVTYSDKSNNFCEIRRSDNITDKTEEEKLSNEVADGNLNYVIRKSDTDRIFGHEKRGMAESCLLDRNTHKIMSSDWLKEGDSYRICEDLVHRDSKLQAISYCYTYPLQERLRANFYFYGNDKNLLLDHVMCQLSHLRDICDDQITIVFYMGFPTVITCSDLAEMISKIELPIDGVVKYMTNSSIVFIIRDFEI